MHWLEQQLTEAVWNKDYNLLGNVHWLEPQVGAQVGGGNYNLLGNVHWLELVSRSGA